MKITTLIARILLGLLFFVFGMNGFLHFIPMPPLSGAMGDFMNGMIASKYFMPLLAFCEALPGFLLLIGMWVPFALVMLAPIIVNILLLHASIDPAGIGMGIFVAILEIYLAFFAEPYRSTIRPLFRRK